MPVILQLLCGQMAGTQQARGVAKLRGADVHPGEAGHDEPADLFPDQLQDQGLDHDAAAQHDARGVENVGQGGQAQHDLVHPPVQDCSASFL